MTGYYPIVSNDSALTLPLDLGSALVMLEYTIAVTYGMGAWLAMLAGVVFAEWMRQNIIVNCQFFAERSSWMLSWAVTDTLKQFPNRPIEYTISFADVYNSGFDGTRSVLTANSWLFGIKLASLTPPTFTLEETVPRQACCNKVYPSEPDKLVFCQMASIGHPNPRGARAYADLILGILFPHRITVHVSPSPVPLGVPTSVVISAEDVLTHAPVAGTVKLRNFDSLGRSVYAQFPTDTPYATTLREGVIRVFDPELRKWVGEDASPSAVVSVPSYSSVEVPIGW